ncbi:MAG: hypothetical protein WAU11_00010 [Ignavibacteriaceae bacterium]
MLRYTEFFNPDGSGQAVILFMSDARAKEQSRIPEQIKKARLLVPLTSSFLLLTFYLITSLRQVYVFD